MDRLAGKVAVVTGASKGIGASIAEYLAAEGAAVVVNYANSKAGAEGVVRRVKEKGGKAIAIQADVSKLDDIKRLFAETKAAYGKLDVLVNNAGRYEFLPLEEITPEHIHKQFDLNVAGLLLTTQEAAKLIGPGGSILNISSIVGQMPLATAAVYSATKAAVDAITVALSQELGPRKIPGQFAEPRDGRDRRGPQRRLRRQRLPEEDGIGNAARAHRTARGRRACRCLLRVGRRGVGERADVDPVGWTAAVARVSRRGAPAAPSRRGGR